MKKFFERAVALFYGAKVHSNHSAIKGRKSGGTRDNNGVDWKKQKSPGSYDTN